MALSNLHELDKEEYKDIIMFMMHENDNNGLPFFIRKYNNNFEASLHRHQYFQVNYIVEGKTKHVINNNEFTIIKGDIFVIPPYVPHYVKPSKYYMEVIEFEFLPEFVEHNWANVENIESFIDFMYIEPFIVSENQVKPRLNLVGKVQTEVENILNEILNEYRERQSGFLLLVRSLLFKLLILVSREFSKELDRSQTRTIYERQKGFILNSIEYINNNYDKDLNLDEIAKLTMMSRSHFCCIFKSITSCTFTEYVNELRISKAMELLKFSDMRVLDICNNVGFNNVDHFCRLFKQKTGVSPSNYRKVCV